MALFLQSPETDQSFLVLTKLSSRLSRARRLQVILSRIKLLGFNAKSIAFVFDESA
jgi:hypothetical protein